MSTDGQGGRLRRVSVVGCSGSGKSTLGRRLAAVLEVPFVELDAFHWGPDWTPNPPAERLARVEQALSADRWVVDGNYFSSLGVVVRDRADTVVWVNPPKWKVMWRSVTRTTRRVVMREELWNGNRENWRNLLCWRADSIISWAWTSYSRVEERLERLPQEPDQTHLTFYRLRTRRHIERFLASAGDARRR